MDPKTRAQGQIGGKGRSEERRQGKRKCKTIAARRLNKWDISDGIAVDIDLDSLRPRDRSECVHGPRPCPWVSCKFHLYLDVNPKTGSIKLNFPDIEPDEMVESCVLDVADRGPVSLEEVGVIMNLTRERIRQLEAAAAEKIRSSKLAIEYHDTMMRRKQ